MRKHHVADRASDGDIVGLESRLGLHLTEDMREFYRHTDGASLMVEQRWWCRIVPIGEVCRMRVYMYGADDDEYGPASIVYFCDTQDGSGLSVELGSGTRRGEVRFCYPLEFPEQTYWVANSFSEFLARALESRGKAWW